MQRIVSVKFPFSPKSWHFDAQELTLHRGVKIVAESLRGVELGQVTTPPRETGVEEVPGTLKPIVRIATVTDVLRADQNAELEASAHDYAQERIRFRNLPMKLVGVFCGLDDSRPVFFFTANGRVDFRDLVKDLNSHLHARVQLLQIGARDAARLIGGIGPCGQELCCSRWITHFDAISMKMAKDQNLFLNPSKFSGVCGKLMCCLRYEHETYLLTRAAMPSIGAPFHTPHGPGNVIEHDIPRESVWVEVPDYGIVTVRTPVTVAPTQPRCRGGGGCSASECGNCGAGDCASCGTHAVG